MANGPTRPDPATTAAEQELALARTVLTSRGWTITDARVDDQVLTIIARRTLPLPLLGPDDIDKRR